jgi:adenylate kinase
MNVLLIGAPGSGKGTQGTLLSEKLGLVHIATGDLLRSEVADGTSLGKQVAGLLNRGELVPDQLIIDLVMPALAAAADGPGYVLDGFPRTVGQAKQARVLAEELGFSADAAIYLDVPRAELVRRILARARVEGRADDTAEVIGRRLEVFDEATKPLIDYYGGRGLLRSIDASGDVGDVAAQIANELAQANQPDVVDSV